MNEEVPKIAEEITKMFCQLSSIDEYERNNADIYLNEVIMNEETTNILIYILHKPQNPAICMWVCKTLENRIFKMVKQGQSSKFLSDIVKSSCNLIFRPSTYHQIYCSFFQGIMRIVKLSKAFLDRIYQNIIKLYQRSNGVINEFLFYIVDDFMESFTTNLPKEYIICFIEFVTPSLNLFLENNESLFQNIDHFIYLFKIVYYLGIYNLEVILQYEEIMESIFVILYFDESFYEIINSDYADKYLRIIDSILELILLTMKGPIKNISDDSKLFLQKYGIKIIQTIYNSLEKNISILYEINNETQILSRILYIFLYQSPIESDILTMEDCLKILGYGLISMRIHESDLELNASQYFYTQFASMISTEYILSSSGIEIVKKIAQKIGPFQVINEIIGFNSVDQYNTLEIQVRALASIASLCTDNIDAKELYINHFVNMYDHFTNNADNAIVTYTYYYYMCKTIPLMGQELFQQINVLGIANEFLHSDDEMHLIFSIQFYTQIAETFEIVYPDIIDFYISKADETSISTNMIVEIISQCTRHSKESYDVTQHLNFLLTYFNREEEEEYMLMKEEQKQCLSIAVGVAIYEIIMNCHLMTVEEYDNLFSLAVQHFENKQEISDVTDIFKALLILSPNALSYFVTLMNELYLDDVFLEDVCNYVNIMIQYHFEEFQSVDPGLFIPYVLLVKQVFDTIRDMVGEGFLLILSCETICFLIQTGKYNAYMDKFIDAANMFLSSDIIAIKSLAFNIYASIIGNLNSAEELSPYLGIIEGWKTYLLIGAVQKKSSKYYHHYALLHILPFLDANSQSIYGDIAFKLISNQLNLDLERFDETSIQLYNDISIMNDEIYSPFQSIMEQQNCSPDIE